MNYLATLDEQARLEEWSCNSDNSSERERYTNSEEASEAFRDGEQELPKDYQAPPHYAEARYLSSRQTTTTSINNKLKRNFASVSNNHNNWEDDYLRSPNLMNSRNFPLIPIKWDGEVLIKAALERARLPVENNESYYLRSFEKILSGRYPHVQTALRHPTLSGSDRRRNSPTTTTTTTTTNDHMLIYQRLRFLGRDALNLVVSDWLSASFIYASDAEMTEKKTTITKESALASFCLRSGLYVPSDRDMERFRSVLSEKLFGEIVEAVIGAVYVDADYYITRALVYEMANDIYQNLIKNDEDSSDLEIEKVPTTNQVAVTSENIAIDNTNLKGKLQETLAKIGSGGKVVYAVVSEEGPAHMKLFTSSVRINGRKVAEGTGRSKREAESAAAKAALKGWQENGDTFLLNESNDTKPVAALNNHVVAPKLPLILPPLPGRLAVPNQQDLTERIGVVVVRVPTKKIVYAKEQLLNMKKDI